METDDIKTVRATIFAPLVAPAMYFSGIMLFDDLSYEGDERFLLLTLTFSILAPISYAGTILVGIPLLALLRNRNRLTLGRLLVAGFVTGGILFTGYLLVTARLDCGVFALSELVRHIAEGGAMGAAVAYTFSMISGITKAQTSAQN